MSGLVLFESSYWLEDASAAQQWFKRKARKAKMSDVIMTVMSWERSSKTRRCIKVRRQDKRRYEGTRNTNRCADPGERCSMINLKTWDKAPYSTTLKALTMQEPVSSLPTLVNVVKPQSTRAGAVQK